MSAKQKFINYLQSREILNDAHYQYHLGLSDGLAEIINGMHPSQVETTKRLVISQNQANAKVVNYANLYFFPDSQKCCYGVKRCINHPNNNDEFIIAFSTMLQILKSIADENSFTSIREMMEKIYVILENKGHKRNCCIFIGSADSGKSTLVNILLSMYEKYQIGLIKVPLRNSSNTFWLQQVIGTEIYRIEECVLEDIQIVQIMKTLFEGNETLTADVKYSAPITVPRRPVVVTMNGNNIKDIVRFHSSEFEAFQARCNIFLMKTNINNRYQEGDLSLLYKHQEHVAMALHAHFGNIIVQEEMASTTDICNQYITDLLL